MTNMYALKQDTENYIDAAIARLTRRLGVKAQVRKIVVTAIDMEAAAVPVEAKLRAAFITIENYRERLRSPQGKVDFDFILRQIQEQLRT